MTYDNRAPAGARSYKRLKFRRAATLVPLLVFGAWGCSELLEVSLPGSVQSADLADPALAETLALTVQGDFECGLVDHIWWPGLWFDNFLNSSTNRPGALIELRAQLIDVYADPCDSGTGPIWVTLQLPRIDGETIRTLLDEFEAGECNTAPDCSVEDAAWMRARAFFYEAYSIQILSEAFCNFTINAGPLMTPTEAWAEAESRFNSAMTQAALVTADNTAAAADLVIAARIGRARSQLYQGTTTTLVADLAGIAMDYEYESTYDANPGRRRNRIVEINNDNDDFMPHREFLALTINAGGEATRDTVADVDDPRVLIDYEPDETLGARGLIKYRVQQKYTERGDNIPFSTGREALLMIAEVDPAQTVAIINQLRDTWPTIAGLDYVDAGAVANQTALREERRRELYMQGNRHGDKIRWEGMPRPAGMATTSQLLASSAAIHEFEPISEYGSPRGTGGCMSVPFLEVTSNENLN